MSENYNQALKATTVFGGVQVFTIVIGLIKNKFIAVILGADGYGINSLYNSTINLIKLISGLGIDLSGVKEVSEAYQKNDIYLFSRTGITLRVWAWLTGLFGMIIMILLAQKLSVWTFNSNEYRWAYIILSPTVLFLSLTVAETTMLRGTRQIRNIAKASIYSSILSIFFTLPLYYWLGTRGIIPAIILSAFISYILMRFFSKKIAIEKLRHSLKDSLKNGSCLVKLGILMTIGNVIGSLATYLITLLVSHYGGVADVGLYNAGWGVTNQCVGLIFTAMVADYLPRLAAINSDNKKIAECINNQAEIAIIILAPCLCFFMLFLPWIVQILFSAEFLSIIFFTRFFIIGIFLQAASWSISYVLLAKGEGKKYIVTQLVSSVVNIICMGGGYYVWGLKGLGGGFIVAHFFYLVYMWMLAKKRYSFNFEKKFISFFGIQYFLLLLLFAIIYSVETYFPNWKIISIFIGGGICLMTLRMSYVRLNERISIISQWKKWFRK